MKTIFYTVIAMLVLAVAGGLIFIYSGSYNVAATSEDTGIMHWALATTREESIDRRAEDVIPPPASTLSNPQTLRIGFDHYNEMCVVCHGAPGVEAGEAREA